MSNFWSVFLWGLVGLCSAVIYVWGASMVGCWLYQCRKWHERNVWLKER